MHSNGLRLAHGHSNGCLGRGSLAKSATLGERAGPCQQGAAGAQRVRSPHGGRQWWRSCWRWLGGPGRAGLVTWEPRNTRVYAGPGGESGLSPRRLVGSERLGGERTVALQLRWNSGGRWWPPGGSTARGGEREAEVRLARGSNGSTGGAHRENERRQRLDGNRRGVMSFGARGG
jgi:hypothetical protein